MEEGFASDAMEYAPSEEDIAPASSEIRVQHLDGLQQVNSRLAQKVQQQARQLQDLAAKLEKAEKGESVGNVDLDQLIREKEMLLEYCQDSVAATQAAVSERDKLQSELSTVQAALDEARAVNALREQEAEETSAIQNELLNAIQQLRAQRDHLQEELTETQTTGSIALDEAQSTAAQKSQEATEMAAIQNELLGAVQNLRAERDNLRQQLADAKVREQESFAEAEQRAMAVAGFESRVATLQYANEAFQQSVADLRDQLVATVARVGERDATINHLRASLDRSSLQVAECNSQLSEERERIQALQRDLENQSSSYFQSKSEQEHMHKIQIENLCAIVTGLRTEVINAQERASQAEESRLAAVDELAESRSDAAGRIVNLEQLIEQIRDDTAEQQRIYEERILSLNAHIDRIQSEKADKSQTIGSQAQEIRQMQMKVAQAEQQVKEAQEQLRAAQAENQRYNQERSIERRMLHDEIHQVRVEFDEQERKAKSFAADCERLQSENTNLKTQNEELQSDCDRLATIVQELEDQLGLKSSELSDLVRQMDQMKVDKHETMMQQDDVKRHLAQLTQLRAELHQLYENIKQEQQAETKSTLSQ